LIVVRMLLRGSGNGSQEGQWWRFGGAAIVVLVVAIVVVVLQARYQFFQDLDAFSTRRSGQGIDEATARHLLFLLLPMLSMMLLLMCSEMDNILIV